MAWERDRETPLPRVEIERTCLEAGCPTRLSSYNYSDRCWIHREQTFRPTQLLGPSLEGITHREKLRRAAEARGAISEAV